MTSAVGTAQGERSVKCALVVVAKWYQPGGLMFALEFWFKTLCNCLALVKFSVVDLHIQQVNRRAMIWWTSGQELESHGKIPRMNLQSNRVRIRKSASLRGFCHVRDIFRHLDKAWQICRPQEYPVRKIAMHRFVYSLIRTTAMNQCEYVMMLPLVHVLSTPIYGVQQPHNIRCSRSLVITIQTAAGFEKSKTCRGTTFRWSRS